MSSVVLNELLAHIDRLTPQDLQCLPDVEDGGFFSWLRTLPPETVIQGMQRILKESPSVLVLAVRITSMYSWLMSRQKIGPWSLFRFGASGLQVDARSLLLNMRSAMQSFIEQPLFFSVLFDRGTYHGCILRNCMDITPRPWETVFVVLWGGQRFAAASVRTNEQRQILLSSLHIALRGESVEMLDGLHADLVTAYHAGCQDIGGSTLLRHDRDPSITTRLFPNGRPRAQAEE